ncbi:enoyl-CoA hydratase/isomerase family protein [Jatrophihabitans sp.]|uniref:enoyl-CoA hydratase/isomerase family protein n=1 Tax=Jatrophihabitans sp. TaxID=1932789 RepID=UPI0030C761A6|nr:crotonase [Jatrophihabitans sp.]
MPDARYPFPYEPFDSYSTRFERVRLERDERGVLLVQFHKDGGEFSWSPQTHRELTTLWTAIGLDPDNKVIILTGTGPTYLVNRDYGQAFADFDEMSSVYWHQEGRKMIFDLLDIEQPMIAALNGPVGIHSQIPLLCDLVIATPETTISDNHLSSSVIPGDGHHILWPHLLGFNRGRAALITQHSFTAEEALDYGLISEIVPSETLLTRANELADLFLTYNDVTRRTLRQLFMHPIKQAYLDNLGHGSLAESLGILVRTRG